MINSNKITDFTPSEQIAGVMPNDSNIEFIGIRKTKEVLWLQNGSNHYFKDLPTKFYDLLKSAYQADDKAVDYISSLTDNEQRQVEIYTYYMYGEVDGTPDIANGKLSSSENYRDKQNCPSLNFSSKNLNIDDHILTDRQITIIDLIGKDMPDKAIADELGISTKTLDFHKHNLFKAVGVQTRVSLIKKAIQHKVIN
jgi:DNA-binding CsgD family transcriptional regulator